MKAVFLMILICSTSIALSSSVDLPRGGSLNIDHKNWLVLENKVTPELKSLFIFSKANKELKGVILGGTIQDKGACKGPASTDWKVCEIKQKAKKEISHQIYVQRKIGKTSFQNYVISFNYDLKNEKAYSKLVSSLKTSLEKK